MQKIKADEYIDDLPVVNLEPETHIRIRKSFIVPVLVGVATVCSIGGIISGTGFVKSQAETDVPPAVVEVQTTVTETKYAMPPACIAAQKKLRALMDSNRKMAGVSAKQLDLMSAAHQAITERDWQTLNRLGQEQRDLSASVAEPTSVALQGYDEAVRLMSECQDATE